MQVGNYSLTVRETGVYELEQKNRTVLAISDLHAPFQHKNALKFLRWLKALYRPDTIVCLGDEADMAYWSFWDKPADMPGGMDEYKRTLEFLFMLYEEFPNVLCCTSNHTSRPYRVSDKAGLLRDFMKSYHEILKAPPGWVWADRFFIDNVAYEHGEGVSGKDGARQAMIDNQCSTVIGHLHAHAGCVYYGSAFNRRFANNAGFLADPYSLAQRYGVKHRKKGILGSSIVLEGDDSYFVPMPRQWR